MTTDETIIVCPDSGCNQKIRIRTNHGCVRVTCPKCLTRFQAELKPSCEQASSEVSRPPIVPEEYRKEGAWSARLSENTKECPRCKVHNPTAARLPAHAKRCYCGYEFTSNSQPVAHDTTTIEGLSPKQSPEADEYEVSPAGSSFLEAGTPLYFLLSGLGMAIWGCLCYTVVLSLLKDTGVPFVLISCFCTLVTGLPITLVFCQIAGGYPPLWKFVGWSFLYGVIALILGGVANGAWLLIP